MKKIQLVIIALLTLVGNAMADGRYLYKTIAECGCVLLAEYNEPNSEGDSNIEISLNSQNCNFDTDGHKFFAFQMFIVLNDGITLIPDEEEDYGEYVIIPSDRFGDTDKKKGKYGIQIAKKGNGYQIVCLNQQGNAILGNEGVLLTIPVKNVPQNGEAIGAINEIEFTSLEGKAVRFDPEDIIVGVDEIETQTNGGLSKVYNLNGQEVSANGKGILIRNKKKIVNK